MFTLRQASLSPRLATVGVVEWDLAGGPPSHAKIVYALTAAAPAVLNRGGEAPVNLDRPHYRTLLLGLKPGRDYTFHIEATRAGGTCQSPTYPLPTTGSFPDARPVTVQVAQAEKRAPGFIVTSSGTTLPNRAFIIDADGDLVWYAPAPENPTRARLDYAGENMWMLSLNLLNAGGEMRVLSLDGEREQQQVPGLETTHHDFTVMPGGRIAALAWATPGNDPESELVVRAPDGTITRPFRIGNNLYRAETFHANALHYHPFDDSFTIADRNPNVFVNVSASGAVNWQLGGSCDQAPAGDRCVPRDWQVVHGHHWLADGTFLAFNNRFSGPSRIYEFHVDAAARPFTITETKAYPERAASFNLGDVQRLPGGNTLITYATDERIVELDAEGNEVQTFTARIGYANWRPTLYGPPARL